MPEQLEERVALLEAEVERLKHQIQKDPTSLPWWDKITGTFSENAAYDEAMKLGREFNRLKKTYPRIGTMDLKIAAIAITCKAMLLTRNSSDFRQISGLSIEDWTI